MSELPNPYDPTEKPRKRRGIHPAALAEFDYFMTDAGKQLFDDSIVKPGSVQYLINRIHRAFQAGYNAAEKNIGGKR